MFIVTVQFEKLKNSEEYKKSLFSNIQTNEEFEKYLKKELETDNIINFITSIARVENIINGKKINEGIKIPVEELIQKINISENKNKLLKWIKESDKKEEIKKLIDVNNIERKLEIVEELAKVMKVLEANYNEKIRLEEYKKEEKIINKIENNKTENMYHIENIEKELELIDKKRLTKEEQEELNNIVIDIKEITSRGVFTVFRQTRNKKNSFGTYKEQEKKDHSIDEKG
jgi:hypothetical protein